MSSDWTDGNQSRGERVPACVARFGFAGCVLFVVLIWGQLAHVAYDDEPANP
jgi:hypothetical protein